MTLKNTQQGYGWLSITIHWVMAVVLIGMFFVGNYMVDLDYYDTLYHTLPSWHKSVGILIAGVFFFRLAWNFSQSRPGPANAATSRISHLAAVSAHLALYGLVASLIISGYLISTAKGAGIEVFEWFSVPALLSDDAQRGELAGDLHEIFGLVFIGLVALHALASLYHHFILKDNTLKRMLSSKGNNS